MIQEHNVLTKQGRRDYIQENAPTLWKSFMELEQAEREAKEMFRKKYGVFWNLIVSKKRFKEIYLKIATKNKMKNVEELTQSDTEAKE